MKKWSKHTLSDESVFTVIFYRSKKKMIHIETHSNLNKILLLAVGLWPYQQSKFTQFQFIFFCAILSTGIVFQVKKNLTLFHNRNYCMTIFHYNYSYQSILCNLIFMSNEKLQNTFNRDTSC